MSSWRSGGPCGARSEWRPRFTSVVFAAINREPGAELATELIPTALFSTVNLSELDTKLADKGFSRAELNAIIGTLECEIVPFDFAQAVDAGLLRPPTKKQGLSLGDRSCLALALARGLPAYTAERSWADLRLGIDIRLIR
jgi:ribonuclease VapC